ncbi:MULTISPECIES: hypothetical protein [unclassified Pseudofrankia]|uniref:hypothetical protein n=1 Tax=unclassified Pseudofrankia TaxID=2994372 RepID=UPI0008DB2116|nr:MULTISPECIES: hypothetical protein [unclassified Pseudofrankia]MDT3440272.1 hypothetical protein [Pseudofrankia sp. BMG5.37]OHV73419.1 hypothetical protein BCD48_33590 [Pseudofrankia sp. BMG5.36]
MDDDIRELIKAPPAYLFGWPVPLIDEIGGLSRAAYDGRIDLDEWRRRDRDLRASMPPLASPGMVSAMHRRVTEAWREARRGSSDTADAEALLTMMGRLRYLTEPAPTDAELFHELAGITRQLREYSQHDNLNRSLGRRAELIRGWLATSPEYDLASGLEWSVVGRYRWVSTSLGAVPTYVDEARRLALTDAGNAEKAAVSAGIRGHHELPPEIAAAEIRQAMLYSSFAVLLEEAWRREGYEELGDGLAALWNRPATRRLLMTVTADGWPRRLAAYDPGLPTIATGPTGRTLRAASSTPIFHATETDLSASPLD